MFKCYLTEPEMKEMQQIGFSGLTCAVLRARQQRAEFCLSLPFPSAFSPAEFFCINSLFFLPFFFFFFFLHNLKRLCVFTGAVNLDLRTFPTRLRPF